MPGMFHFPYWRNPYYYHNYRSYYNNKNSYSNTETKTKIETNTRKTVEENNNNNNNNTSKEESKDTRGSNKHNQTSATFPANLFQFFPTSFGPLNFHPDALTNTDTAVFELFGIELFLDDIIIICILIFLYKEEVKDEMLYLSLILLLFS